MAIRQRIVDVLASKGGNEPLCPVCHQREFALGPYVALPVTASPVVGSSHFVPCVSLDCQTCGYVLLVGLNFYFTPDELAGMALNGV
jgi:hypothetical protein